MDELELHSFELSFGSIQPKTTKELDYKVSLILFTACDLEETQTTSKW